MADNNETIITDVEVFLDGCNMGADKETMLRYLSEVADSIRFRSRPRGRSIVECEFDCGAHKGSEILTFAMQHLSPLVVAIRLMGLTSGHRFSYKKAEEAILSDMVNRLSGKSRAIPQEDPFADFCLQNDQC